MITSLNNLASIDSAQEEGACPLCTLSICRGKRGVRLYNETVCRKCWRSHIAARQVAYAFDFVAYGLAGRVVVLATSFIVTEPRDGQWNLMIALSVAVALRVPFIMKDGFAGYSPGKWIMGLRVYDTQTGLPIGFFQSAQRNCVLLAPFIGELIILLSQTHGRRFCDSFSRSIVVSKQIKDAVDCGLRWKSCLFCGYCLIGNASGRCSECGLKFGFNVHAGK